MWTGEWFLEQSALLGGVVVNFGTSGTFDWLRRVHMPTST
jgi:hypothetical protein